MEQLRQAIEQMTKEDLISLIDFVAENGSAEFVRALVGLLIAFELVHEKF
jgi:hypothetical protein